MNPSTAKLVWQLFVLVAAYHGSVQAFQKTRLLTDTASLLQVDDQDPHGQQQPPPQQQELPDDAYGIVAKTVQEELVHSSESSVKSTETVPAESWSPTALFQAFAELSRNASNFTKGLLNITSANEKLQSLGVSSLAQVVPTGLHSANVAEELHSLEKQSPQSAQLVREVAAIAANQTEGIFSEVKMRSAVLLAGIRLLQQQSLQKGGKAGPSHAYPHVHVVARLPDPKPAHVWARHSDGSLEAIDEDSILGTLRISMTVAGAMVIALSILLNTNREGSAMSALKAWRVRESTHRAVAIQDGDSTDKPRQADTTALSVWDGTVATFSCIVGTGLLAMPYAFSLAGMIAAPMVVFFVLSSAYTAHLMSWSLNETGQFSLGALVERAFGRRARSAVSAFLIVELWGYLLSALVCGSMNVAQLVEGLDSCWAVAIFALAAYALSFAPTHVMTRINVLSNVSFVLCCSMFIITGLLLPTKAPAEDVQFVKPQGLMTAAGILVFSPAGHSFYPALMERMEEPAKFPVCVRRAYAAACALYLVVAATGYYLFGNAAQPSAVINIGADLALAPLPNLGWMNSLAAAGMAAKMLALSTLVLTPLISTVKNTLSGKMAAEPAALGRFASPCILLVSAGVAVHFAHEMATLLNLMGAVFCMNIAFVLPVLCYWKLSKEPLGLTRGLVLLGLVIMGSGFAIVGLISAL